jgi:RNA 2',3'-cyclic 3'-phosphodiesterase
MRLFAALPLSDPAALALAQAAAALRCEDWPVRWADPSLLHLTLKFYGEVPDERVVAIADGIGAATRDSPAVALEVTGLGTLPGGRAARVVVAEVAPEPALELLQHSIESAGAAIGIPLEGRPFRPHLTLGRVRHGARLPDGADARIRAEPVSVTAFADTVELFESRPGSGPRYRSRRSYRLVA